MKRSSFIIHTWLRALMLASAVLAQGTGNAGEALITARVDKGAIVNTTPLAMFCNQIVYTTAPVLRGQSTCLSPTASP